MTDYQENVISMFYKVKLFILTYFGQLIARAPMLTTLADAFNDLIANLVTCILEANEKLTGYAFQKQENRSTMRDKTLLIANGIEAHYLALDQNEMAQKAHLTKSDIDGARDTEAKFKCEKVIGMAAPILVPLIQVGVTAQMVDNANLARQAYEDFMGAPAHERAESAAYGKEIDKVIPKVMKKLTIIDNVIGTLREEFSVICSIWDGDRSIDDNTGPGTVPTVARPIAPLTIDPIVNILYEAGRQWKITNCDPDNSILYGISTLNNAFSHPNRVLGPGKTVKFLSIELGSDGDFLLIQNITTLPMEVKVWVIE